MILVYLFRHTLFEIFVKIFVKSSLLSNISNKKNCYYFKTFISINRVHFLRLHISTFFQSNFVFGLFEIHKDVPLFALFIQNVCHFPNTDTATWCRRCKGDKFVSLLRWRCLGFTDFIDKNIQIGLLHERCQRAEISVSDRVLSLWNSPI